MTKTERDTQHFRDILNGVDYDEKLTLFRIVTTLKNGGEKAEQLLKYLSENIGNSAADADAFLDSIGA